MNDLCFKILFFSGSQTATANSPTLAMFVTW